MAIFRVGGSAWGPTGMFAWTAEYNDQGNRSVTITSSGPSVGRGLAVIRQEDGRSAAIYFVQDAGGERYPLPAGEDVAVEREKLVNSVPLVISPVPRLRPSQPDPSKPGDVGGFESATYWAPY